MQTKFLPLVLLFLGFSCTKKQLDPEEKVYHTVEFKTNSDIEIDKQLVENSFKVKKPDIVLTKDMYSFIEWTLEGSRYDFENPLTKNIVLEAKWGINVQTVKFDLGDGQIPKEINIEAGDILKDIEDPKRQGYLFVEWSLNGNKFDINTTPIKEDITIEAQWLELTREVVFTEEQRQSLSLIEGINKVIYQITNSNPKIFENPSEFMKKFSEEINKEFLIHGIDYRLIQKDIDNIQMFVHKVFTIRTDTITMDKVMYLNGFCCWKRNLIQQLEYAGLNYTGQKMIDEMNSIMYKIKTLDDGTDDYKMYLGFTLILYMKFIDIDGLYYKKNTSSNSRNNPNFTYSEEDTKKILEYKQKIYDEYVYTTGLGFSVGLGIIGFLSPLPGGVFTGATLGMSIGIFVASNVFENKINEKVDAYMWEIKNNTNNNTDNIHGPNFPNNNLPLGGGVLDPTENGAVCTPGSPQSVGPVECNYDGYIFNKR